MQTHQAVHTPTGFDTISGYEPLDGSEAPHSYHRASSPLAIANNKNRAMVLPGGWDGRRATLSQVSVVGPPATGHHNLHHSIERLPTT